MIVKASGERELFSSDKLLTSLLKAGVSREIAEDVMKKIQPLLREGMTTKDLYRQAFGLLKKESTGLAARYGLKQAIYALGPSGFPFERFVSHILANQGYATKVGVTLRGRCVTHEVDVEAVLSGRHIMVECKFHNQQGVKTNVKTTLYIKARFDDIREADHAKGTVRIHEGWLVTNTKLTSDAVAYAACSGIKAIGWGYPSKGNLQDLIEKSGLHPLTCLTTFTPDEKKRLLDRGTVLCREIGSEELTAVGVSGLRAARVRKEIDELCKTSKHLV